MENGDIAHFVCHASNVTDLIKWEKDGKEVKDGKEGVAIVTCNRQAHISWSSHKASPPPHSLQNKTPETSLKCLQKSPRR